MPTAVQHSTCWALEDGPPTCDEEAGSCSAVCSRENKPHRFDLQSHWFAYRMITLVGGVAQWLGRRSLAGGLSLIYG